MVNNAALEKLFDYEEYQRQMENSKVRIGSERTNTMLDFVTVEQREKDKLKGINDLSEYDPTPLEIKEHFIFINRIIKDLVKKNPDDVFLQSLMQEEGMQPVFASYNWYENYGIIK